MSLECFLSNNGMCLINSHLLIWGLSPRSPLHWISKETMGVVVFQLREVLVVSVQSSPWGNCHGNPVNAFVSFNHECFVVLWFVGERGGSVVECRTPEREVRGSRPTAAVLCPWARHFTPRKYWLITQEAMAPSRHDWKIVDWDFKPQHNQPTYDLC